ncbi:MAG: hypothetical protein NG747_07145 [Candidatus Brocadia sp.]|nr:hypothetical protein [Candidatus Brocadia sp.]
MTAIFSLVIYWCGEPGEKAAWHMWPCWLRVRLSRQRNWLPWGCVLKVGGRDFMRKLSTPGLSPIVLEISLHGA